MKKTVYSIVLVFAMLLVFSSSQTFAISSDKPLTANTFIEVSQKVLPSVVSIQVKKSIGTSITLEDENGPQSLRDKELEEFLKRFFPNNPGFQAPGKEEEKEFSAAGSGVIISKDGYIITNNHVISQVKDGNIEVKFHDDKKISGDKVKIIGTDPLTDIAVIQIVGVDNLQAAIWGNSDNLAIGEWVLALGNPLELNNSVTQGIISAKGREIQNAPLEDFLQTTAIINPGNSGGPLVNLDGELVGINSAIASNTGYWQGIGFAIPSNNAKFVSDKIIEGGKVKRGYLGIIMGDLTPDIAKVFNREPKTGIIVSKVNAGTPAEAQGIKAGDVVIKVDGKDIKDPQSMVKLIANKPVGAKVDIKILRYLNGKIEEKDFAITLMERPAENDLLTKPGEKQQEAAPDNFSELGLMLDDKPAAEQAPGKVVVKAIKPGTPASKSSLVSGDVILEVNGKEIKTVNDFNEAVKAADQTKGLFIQYERNTTRAFTVITIEKAAEKAADKPAEKPADKPAEQTPAAPEKK